MDHLTDFLARRGFEPRGSVPPDFSFDHVTEDSRACGPRSVFVAIKGNAADGHAFLSDAAARGARVALVTDASARAPEGMTLVAVADARRALGPLAQAAAGDPSAAMDVVGVTGTNGKTTTAYMMEAIFRAAGRRPGILGTVAVRWEGRELPAGETTPSGSRLAEILKQMREAGVDSVAMEVSSHAIDQRRVDGIHFRAMALTNVTQDHLDYHKTMEEYAAVKMSIFTRMRETEPAAAAVVNLDDPTGAKLARELPAEGTLAYALDAPGADLRCERAEFHERGMTLDLNFRGTKMKLESPLFCRFNASNCLTGAGLALAVGIAPEAIAEGIRSFRGAPGRFELIEGLPGVRVVVDYAHTPDALEKLLANAKGIARGRLIAVFGCGGDRDRSKRPLMGKIGAELADIPIVTSDNPRTEAPEEIVKQILEGADRANGGAARRRAILDRRTAIGEAIAMAEPGDVVVIAGKGHEDYQIIGTTKHHFDDRETAREFIAARARAN